MIFVNANIYENQQPCLNTNLLSQEQQQQTVSADLGKGLGDLNMKLKMEVGALKGENEGLHKRNAEIQRQVSDLDNQIQVKYVLATAPLL